MSYEKEEQGKFMYMDVPSSYKQVDLRPGEIFVIPNLKSYIFGDLQTNPLLQMINYTSAAMGHGVLPYVQEPYRAVALIDFMFADPSKISESNNDQILIDLGRALDLLS